MKVEAVGTIATVGEGSNQLQEGLSDTVSLTAKGVGARRGHGAREEITGDEAVSLIPF
jgi:hypothetical protein